MTCRPIHRLSALLLVAAAQAARADIVIRADHTVEPELPPAMQVLYVPKDLAIRRDGLDCPAAYTRAPVHDDSHHGPRYHLERRVVAGQPRGWCTPEEYQALRPAMNRISRALHGRLVFVLNDTEVATAESHP